LTTYSFWGTTRTISAIAEFMSYCKVNLYRILVCGVFLSRENTFLWLNGVSVAHTLHAATNLDNYQNSNLSKTALSVKRNHLVRSQLCRITAIFMPQPLTTYGAGRIMFLSMSVRKWVCEWVCASRKTCEHPYLKNQWREFYQILVTYIFGFIDVLIRFFGQMSNVKVTAGHSRKTWRMLYLRHYWS